jgi:hypothetical protein
MTRAMQHELQNMIEQDKRDNLDALLSEQVVHALGEPRDLLRVQVCKLWQRHYRVDRNVILWGAST